MILNWDNQDYRENTLETQTWGYILINNIK